MCGRRAVELAEEAAAAGAVAEHEDPLATTGDADVQDAALLLDVLGQAVRDDPVGDAEHHDAIPLAALHPVDRAQRDAALGPLAVERAPEPRLERRRVGVEVGHLQQRLEVVEVRAARAAGAVEQRHRRAEADVVAHRGEEVAGAGALGGERRQPVEVDGQVVELLGDLHVVDAGGGLAHVGDRAAAVEPLHRPLRQPAARPAVHLGEIGAAHVLRIDRDAQVGERRPHPEAREHALVEDRVDRHAGLRQRHVRRQQQRLHPRQHRGLARATRPARPASPAPRRPALARRCRRRASARANASVVGDHGGTRPDLLGDPHPVVGEQRGGRLGDRRRAPVVHLEGVLGGARGSRWRSR